ncbi:MAG: hypothetical protein HZA35_01250 [Parcubacteria group bacterium]|nr:hypothetical protein [Parcubacteria group bacterium]
MKELPPRDFFEIITEITKTHCTLHKFGFERGHHIQRGLRNTLCHIWATATDDDLLNYVARARIDLNKYETTIESVREVRALHRFHLALGQKH